MHSMWSLRLDGLRSSSSITANTEFQKRADAGQEITGFLLADSSGLVNRLVKLMPYMENAHAQGNAWRSPPRLADAHDEEPN